MAAANHRKTIGMVDVGATLAQGNELLAGVDQPRLDLVLGGRRAHPENTVLGVEDHLAVQRHMFGNLGRDPNAEIDIPAFRNVACQASRHLWPGKTFEAGRKRGGRDRRGCGHVENS